MSNKKFTLSIRSIRSDGVIFDYELSGHPSWHLTSIEGLDFPSLEIFKEDRGFGNGSIITGKRKEARTITLKSRCSYTSKSERSRVIGFHNNNYTFDLYIEYMGIKRIAKNCELSNCKCPTGNMYSPLTVTAEYLHPESDLISDESENIGFYDISPTWHVTRAYNASLQNIFGIITNSITKYIDYTGSENTFVTATVEIKSYTRGLNFAINDKILKINKEFASGDKLVIDSEWKKVELNNAEISPNYYNGEMLPELILTFGDNKISVYDNKNDNSTFTVQLKYTGRYGGL